jgi:hypothetical protein
MANPPTSSSPQPLLIRSLSEYIETLKMPAYLLGLAGAPVTPWYLGQADATGKLLPTLYKGNANAELEREMLREFRMLAAEFIAPKGVTDREWLMHGHQNGLPSRIIEWQGNAQAALFLAVETMDAAKHGRVWVFNPWAYNGIANDLAYVPMIDEAYADPYVVKVSDPEASGGPKAELPMAFRPYRNVRNYNTQNIFITIHGNIREPLDGLRFPGAILGPYLTFVLIDGTRKKAIMKELHLAGVTRASLFPGVASVAKVVAYRYSKDYVISDV